MRKKLLVFGIAITIVNTNVFAQENEEDVEKGNLSEMLDTYSHYDVEPSPSVWLLSNAEVNSTAITSAFYTKLYQGGFIDQSLKDQVKNRLTSNNLLGGEFNSSIYYHSGSPALFKNKFSYAISLGYTIDFAAKFSSDLFNFTFYGNKSFENKTADFSDTRFKMMTSQFVGFSLIQSSDKYYLTVGLNLIKGQNYYDFSVNKGSVYTAPSGSYLDVVANGSFVRSDATHNDFTSFNGMGAGLNLIYNRHLKDNSNLVFSASNVGAMYWNSATVRTNVDTSVQFDGLKVDNIFSIQDSLFTNVSGKNVFNDYTHNSSASRLTLLPMTFRADYYKYFEKGFQFLGSIQYKNWGSYIPRATATLGFRLPAYWYLHVGAGYGGYGQAHLSLGLSGMVGKTYLMFGSSDCLGFIALNKFSNEGLYLKAFYHF